MSAAAPTRPTADRGVLVPRIAFTALVALFEAAHLAWEQSRGGIASHHLLNDPTLPALWNGWGLLLLPALAWFASARAFRIAARPWTPGRDFALHLGGAALAGIALSVAFLSGSEQAAATVFLGIALSSLAVRAYRAEVLLGFALGMAVTFGGILPLLIGGVLAVVSAIAWFVVRPLLRRAVAAMRG